MKKEEAKKVKPDAHLKGGKKGTAELSEDQLKGVTGGAGHGVGITYDSTPGGHNTNTGGGHNTNTGGGRQGN